MAQDTDEERIRRKAHELWQAEGHPHGRDLDHWEQAREIIAIQDSQASTLLPRDTGAEEPVEYRDIAESGGDIPNLTDQGSHDLTDTSRETASAVAPMTSDEMLGTARSSPRALSVSERPADTTPAKTVVPPNKTAPKLAAKSEGSIKTGKPLPRKKKK